MTERARQLSGERIIFWLRWFVLACVVLVVLLDPVHRPDTSEWVPFLAAAVIYNLAIAIMIYLRLYFKALPVLTLAVDVVVVLALIHLPSGAGGFYAVFAIFPILVALFVLSSAGGNKELKIGKSMPLADRQMKATDGKLTLQMRQKMMHCSIR